MLVLSREHNQEIVISTESGEIISLMVIEIRGNKVRLGFDASRKVQIHRREVFEAIHGPLSGHLAKNKASRKEVADTADKEHKSDGGTASLHIQPQHDPQPPDPA